MNKMKNEGTFERSLQSTISAALFLSAFFLVTGIWQIVLFILATAIAIFAAVGFCPLYVVIGKNTACCSRKSTEVKK